MVGILEKRTEEHQDSDQERCTELSSILNKRYCRNCFF